MTYFQNLNRLILKELELRAQRFADSYESSDPSIILVPGGMGSKLLQCEHAYGDDDFPSNPPFGEIWLDWPAILFGKIGELALDQDEWDYDQKPVIASGEMNSIIKSYDGTEDYFVSNHFNYTEFGYDWRRDVRSAAGYLRAFLTMIKNKIPRGTSSFPAKLTLFSHSMGGLVVKLMINELVADNEDPKEWFHRFVSVASPFYGTETHFDRYYRGERRINLLLGSTDKVARMVASMPGPYGLLPCPQEILETVLDPLGLSRYPVRDATQDQVAIDPFGPAGRLRFPLFVNGTYLARAEAMFQQINRQLPEALYENIFHIHNNIRKTNRPLEWQWDTIHQEQFLPGAEAPIATNEGSSDGTVPVWAARLAHTPDANVFPLSINTDHGALAEDPRVLYMVRKIAKDTSPFLPGPDQSSPSGPIAPLSAGEYTHHIDRIIREIKSGQSDAQHLKALPETEKRALMSAISLC